MELYIRVMTCFAGMIVSAVSIVIVTRLRPSEAQKWTLLTMVSLFIYNAANYIKPHYADASLYIYMQIVIYAATALIGLSFGFALLEFCEIKASRLLRILFGGVILFCIALIATIGHHDCWFKGGITFIQNPEFPNLYDNDWAKGPMFYFVNGLLMAVALAFVAYLLVNIIKKKGRKTRILKILICILLLPSSVTILSLFRVVPNAIVNHATFIMLNIAILIIIIRYDITMTVSDAKEQAVETVNDGIIIMDSNRHFQYANAKAINIFPELADNNPDIVTAFIDLEFATNLITKAGRTYEIRKDRECDTFGHTRGNLILIHDITEQEERIREQEKAYRAEETLNQSILAMAHAIDAKDPYTSGHSNRVADYAQMLAEKMGMDAREIKDIHRMGLLHDIGKIGINDAIIRKDSSLTDEEYAMIKSHTVKGDEILKNITSLPELHAGARWHHERYDGKGYPDRLSGENIPLCARIIAVADCYDAMSSNRSYRKALPQSVIRSEIEKGMGTQFDPHIAALMLEIIDNDKEYRLHE